MKHANTRPGADATGPRDAVSAGERNDANLRPSTSRRQGFTADELERARTALAYIDPRDHDTWLKVGMGLKAEFGDDAWLIFDEWSLLAENYDANENRRRWRSFKPGGGITIATLYGTARDAGWRDDGTYRVPDVEELAAKAKARAQAETEHRSRDEQAAADTAKEAVTLWSIAGPVTGDNPYCQRKGVTPTETLREIDGHKAAMVLGYTPQADSKELQGSCLVVPIKTRRKLTSAQLIDGSGRKRFLKGGVISGGYWASQSLPAGGGDGLVVLIGEGVATALSARQAMHVSLVVAAMSNWNLPAVVRQVREQMPKADIVVLADVDKETGEPDRYALQAAEAVGGRLAVPQFSAGPAPDRNDFNDVARLHGNEAVRKAIEAAGLLAAPSASVGGDTAIGWPDLVPLDGGELPKLSPNSLGGWLGDYARAVAEATEVPLELSASMTLGAVSVATARRVSLQVKQDYFEPLNLWLLPALAPGNRKSAVERLAVAPLREWESEQAAALKVRIEEVEAAEKVALARAKELRAEAAKCKDDAKARDLADKALEVERSVPVVPRPPQLWTSDATPESLGVLLAENDERMAWISSEGGLFETIGGRYSKGMPNLDLMLKAHSGDSERVDRMGRPPVYLQEPLLTVAMSPQPELLRGLVDKPGFRGRGLLGRFLYFFPESPLGNRTLDGPAIPDAIRNTYHRRLRAMLDWPLANGDRRHLIRLSDEARAIHREFALRIEAEMRPGGAFEHAQDWAGKAPGAAARVAGVLHAADHAGEQPWEIEIPPETMERAADFVAVSGKHALAAFRLMAVNEALSRAQRVWEWLERRQLAAFQAREVWQGLKGSGAFARMADVTGALEVLEERGYVRSEAVERSGAGRPASPRYLVRPDLNRWGRP